MFCSFCLDSIFHLCLEYQVRFDHPSMTIEIPIVVTQSGEEIARVNFTYQSCK
jgi:hypothetical protein